MSMANTFHPDHGPDLSSDWIRANVQAAAVIAAGGLAADLVHMAIKPVATEGLFASIGVVSVIAVIYTIGTTGYAWLTGRVLARRLPAFPMRGWLGVHVALGLIAGTAFGTTDVGPDTAGDDDALTGSAALVACVAISAALAAAFAAVQSLVLRRAVRNVGRWISLSALGGVALGLSLLPGFLKNSISDAGDLVIQHAVEFLIFIIMAIVLLPAVQKFQPR